MNFNGELLEAMCRRQNMTLINTYWNIGPSFYGYNKKHGEYTSRVDYIAISMSARMRVKRMGMNLQAGRDLQVIPDTRRRDHIPMYMVIDLSFNFQRSFKKEDRGTMDLRFSQDAMAECATRGLQKELHQPT